MIWYKVFKQLKEHEAEVVTVDYTRLLDELNQASLFDLYRLNIAISNELDNPNRQAAVKQKLHLHMELTYFDPTKNRLVKGRLIEMRPKKAVVFDYEQDKRFIMPYYMLNIEGTATDITRQGEQLTANNLKVGDCVGFNKAGKDIVGIIKSLNQKTVTLITTVNERWRVAYVYLYRVHDAETVQQQLLR